MKEVGGDRIDDLARDLANGSISRRTALRRLAAGALGIGLATTPSALASELERARCPKSRRCNGKCCPKGARCKNGKCKCNAGLVKCDRKCVDVQTSAQNCGACGIACAAGETCVAGQCMAPAGTCGDGVISGGEDCDGANLGGQTCLSLGFTGGTLACGANCTFDTSGCASLEGCGSRQCGQAPNGDDCGVCSAGETCENGQCLSSTCGNGIIEQGEQCDDGTTSSGNGCSSTCQIETGWYCTGEPSVCVTMCGDGIIAGGEQCDTLGPMLNGATCQSLGFSGGTLGCSSSCTYDTSGCTE